MLKTIWGQHNISVNDINNTRVLLWQQKSQLITLVIEECYLSKCLSLYYCSICIIVAQLSYKLTSLL